MNDVRAVARRVEVVLAINIKLAGGEKSLRPALELAKPFPNVDVDRTQNGHLTFHNGTTGRRTVISGTPGGSRYNLDRMLAQVRKVVSNDPLSEEELRLLNRGISQPAPVGAKPSKQQSISKKKRR